MAFENTLYSSHFYFIYTRVITVIYRFMVLLKFLYNVHMGLLKYLSSAVIFKAK